MLDNIYTNQPLRRENEIFLNDITDYYSIFSESMIHKKKIKKEDVLILKTVNFKSIVLPLTTHT